MHVADEFIIHKCLCVNVFRSKSTADDVARCRLLTMCTTVYYARVVETSVNATNEHTLNRNVKSTSHYDRWTIDWRWHMELWVADEKHRNEVIELCFNLIDVLLMNQYNSLLIASELNVAVAVIEIATCALLNRWLPHCRSEQFFANKFDWLPVATRNIALIVNHAPLNNFPIFELFRSLPISHLMKFFGFWSSITIATCSRWH